MSDDFPVLENLRAARSDIVHLAKRRAGRMRPLCGQVVKSYFHRFSLLEYRWHNPEATRCAECSIRALALAKRRLSSPKVSKA